MLEQITALSTEYLVISIIIIFISYMVKGLSGFGSGLVAVPLLAFLFPLHIIVPVLGLLSYSGTIMQSYSTRKDVAWKDLFPLMPFSLMGVVFALWLLTTIDSNILILYLGVFVVIYSVHSLLPVAELSGGRVWSVVAGSTGGLIGALFGTGGPPYIIYLKLRQVDKRQFRATIAMIFLFDGAFRITGYAMTGLYSLQALLLVLIMLPVLLAGMYVGNHIHLKLSQDKFNKVINLLLLVSGFMLIIKSL